MWNRFVLSAALSMCFMPAAFAQSTTYSWKRLAYENDQYSIEFPEKPEEYERMNDTGKVKVTVLFRRFRSEAEQIDYWAVSQKLPEIDFPNDVPAVIDGFQRGMVPAAGATNVRTKKTDLNEQPGRIILFDLPNDRAGELRVYITKDQRLISAFVTGRKTGVEGRNAERFLDSLNLIVDK